MFLPAAPCRNPAGMISARQIRAARALLGWSQQDLADRAIISVNALRRLEGEQVDPRLSTIAAVKTALESAGVDFLSASGAHGEGVRLRSP
jgi:predicted transcriptional regulator